MPRTRIEAQIVGNLCILRIGRAGIPLRHMVCYDVDNHLDSVGFGNLAHFFKVFLCAKAVAEREVNRLVILPPVNHVRAGVVSVRLKGSGLHRRNLYAAEALRGNFLHIFGNIGKTPGKRLENIPVLYIGRKIVSSSVARGSRIFRY